MKHLFLTTRVPSKFRELVAFLSLVAVFFVGAWVLFIAPNAKAHPALPTAAQPHGWSYPLSCCSGYDCREVAYNAVAERREGYVIKRTGEVITYTDSRIRNSPDGLFHWCSAAGANDGRTVCLFVPPHGY
ncbi:hypothetical protein [Sinorhizobium chiapasense]|uniref:Transmembrane protein n=1 Tax=Sinorhizobium chiapasense TaxID=501572 RepID=A0ABZ2BN89_9HYPH